MLNSKGSFVDTDRINPRRSSTPRRHGAQLATWVLSPMRDRDLLEAGAFDGKWATLVSGQYGGGKTGLVACSPLKSAVANGWSAIMCEVGDDPFEMIELAKLYALCFFFCEDVDQIGFAA